MLAVWFESYAANEPCSQNIIQDSVMLYLYCVQCDDEGEDIAATLHQSLGRKQSMQRIWIVLEHMETISNEG